SSKAKATAPAREPGEGIGAFVLLGALALCVVAVAGSVVGALIIARKGTKEGRKTAIPFGPYLAVGGLVALFAGDAIVDWYVDTFI
ncbi:MAG: hypothetical protein M3O90_06210, partial [Actinomycetota bacterium]|nr:hypothetical protein [Actinomycetota bacterium]